MDNVDFTSLYPYIQKYGEFPIGHPIIITENFESIDSYSLNQLIHIIILCFDFGPAFSKSVCF